MGSCFTAAELRLLALSDAADRSSRPNNPKGGRPVAMRLGRLSHAQALAIHESGVAAADIASAADVAVCTVYEWRKRNGLTRTYNRKATA